MDIDEEEQRLIAVTRSGVYIFHKMGSRWIEEAVLPSISAGRVAIDKGMALLGDPASNKVRMYILRGGQWQRGTDIDISPRSVALEGDYALIARGAVGGVFAYRREGDTLRQVGELLDVDGETLWGFHIALHEDLAVLSPPPRAGVGDRVLIFRRVNEDWHLETEIPVPGGPVVERSGERVLIGTPHADASVPDGGAAFVYRRDGQGWIREAELESRYAYAEQLFGRRVHLSGDYAVVDFDAVEGLDVLVQLYTRHETGWTPATVLEHREPGFTYITEAVATDGEQVFVLVSELPVIDCCRNPRFSRVALLVYTIPVNVAVEELDEQPPALFHVGSSYPNPFRDAATIPLFLPAATHVSAKIFNTIGEQVATLYEGMLSAGEHTLRWQPDGLPSGVYFNRLQVGGHVATQRLVMIRH